MKKELAKEKPDKTVMEVDSIGEKARGVKRKLEEIKEDQSTLSEHDRRKLRKQQSMLLNAKKL